MTAFEDLEREVGKLPEVELGIVHDFCEGIYARTMIMLPGTIVVGMTHAHGALTVVRSGRCTVNTGNDVLECFGGEMFVSEAGAKRAFFAHERTVVTCFVANPQEIREPDKLWNYYTVDNNLVEHKEQELLEGAA